jgi:hypothetical protein
LSQDWSNSGPAPRGSPRAHRPGSDP